MKFILLVLWNSLLLLVLSHVPVIAQPDFVDSGRRGDSQGVKGYFNQLKFAPLKLLGPVNPGLELSYERRYKSRWSSQVAGTYLLPRAVYVPDGVDPDKKGFKIAMEQKYYLGKLAHKGKYLAGEVEYMYSHNRAAMNFGPTFFQHYKDTFELTKHNFCLNLKFGYYTSFKRMIIDFYGGIGLQYRDATHSGRSNPQDQLAPSRHYNLPMFYNREGRSWNVNFPLGLRIGYLF